MENTIITIVLIAVIIIAAVRAVKHFKGGGCCGSKGTAVRSKKKLKSPKLGEKVLVIEGMHCENCRNRVEHAVNNLDGVVCKVNLRKNTATVSYSSEVSDAVLTQAVEKLGFVEREIQQG